MMCEQLQTTNFSISLKVLISNKLRPSYYLQYNKICSQFRTNV